MDPANQNQGQEVKHDIFEDPAIGRALKEDPVFAYLSKNWRQALVAILAVGAVLYAKNQFQRTRRTALDESAQVFRNVSAEYSNFSRLGAEVAAKEKEKPSDPAKLEGFSKELDELKKKREEASRGLTDLLAALGDAREPYSTLVPLYTGLMRKTTEGPDAIAAALGEPNWQQAEPDDRLLMELEALAKGRALLDNEQSLERGRQALAALADEGTYVSAAAAIALAKVARSSEERATARAILERLIARAPEQRELLEPELARLAG